MNQRHLYNKTHRIKNYLIPDDTSDFYEDIIETNINNKNIYTNLRQINLNLQK